MAASIFLAGASRRAKIDVIAIDTWGVLFSVVAATLVVILGLTVNFVSRRSASPEADENTSLKGGEPTSDPCSVGLVALCGSIALLGLSTVLGLQSGQLAPLAISAIGLSILFTIRPVRLVLRCGCYPVLLFDMALVPWLCIAWQVFATAMPIGVIRDGIVGEEDGEMEPWTCLVTFIGAVYLCISLEVTGGLVACARAIASRFGSSPPSLFLCIATMAAFMTVLIPDDVVTMTLAPTVCLLATSLRLDAEPHLFAQFYNANIFAVTLVTGNITNVLIADVTGDLFLSFARVMVLPGLVAGCVAVVLLYLAFRSVLNAPPEARRSSVEDAEALLRQSSSATFEEVRYPIRGIICVVRLALIFTFAAFDFLHHWPIWFTVGVFAGIALLMDLFVDAVGAEGSSRHTLETIKSLPYDVFIFFPALFVLVQQLVHVGVIDFLARGLEVVAEQPVAALVTVGLLSMWTAQAVSAVPMTILFVQVITRVPEWRHPQPGTSADTAKALALYSLVLGSNFCGNVTRMGTMGGQMWFRIASNHGIALSDVRVACKGFYIMVPVMLTALATLYCAYHIPPISAMLAV